MKTITYRVQSERIARSLCIALTSDLHDRDGGEALRIIEANSPDLIAVAGDLTQRLDLPEGARTPHEGTISHQNALAFLRRCARIAPTFYALGNHEICSCRGQRGELDGEEYRSNLRRVAQTGAVLLWDSIASLDGISIAGTESGYIRRGRVPELSVVDRLEQSTGLRILICHHPEYYPRYLKERDLDLILSGHAHGGQIRLLGRGLYAPGQGILPKYAGGIYDGKLVVSRGLCNTVAVPRLFNPPEVVIISVLPKEVM